MNKKYSRVTFTMSLPRSRTKWLTEIVKPWAASYHDPLVKHPSIDAFGQWLDETLEVHGDKPVLIADTIAVFFYEQIVARFPGAKLMFLFREPLTVIDSLRKMDPTLKHDEAVWEQSNKLRIAYAHAKAARVNECAMFDFVNLCHASHVIRAINFVISPVPFQYAYDVARKVIVADHEKAKRETDPAVVRKLFASAGVS